MGMADQRDPLRLDVEAELGLKGGQHVLPDRIAGTGVIQADRLLEVGGLEAVQVLAGRGGDRLLGPGRGQRRPAGELLQRQAAAHAEVVVTGQADGGVLAGQVDAGVGIGAVPDQIAEAPELAAVGIVDGIEHRLEGVTVAVDVGDDRDLASLQSRL